MSRSLKGFAEALRPKAKLLNVKEGCEVTIMRCYFIRGGHIVDVDELTGPSDEEAIAKAHELFSEREPLFENFELWTARGCCSGIRSSLPKKQRRRLSRFIGLETRGRLSSWADQLSNADHPVIQPSR